MDKQQAKSSFGRAFIEYFKHLSYRGWILFGGGVLVVGRFLVLSGTTDSTPFSKTTWLMLGALCIVIASFQAFWSVLNERDQAISEAQMHDKISTEEHTRLKLVKAILVELANTGRTIKAENHFDDHEFKRWQSNTQHEVAIKLSGEHKKSFGRCWTRIPANVDPVDRHHKSNEAFDECIQWLEIHAKKIDIDDLNDLYRYGSQ